MDRLYQLTSDLREELQEMSASGVLSVRMYKRTEEIEKLAKQLKSKVPKVSDQAGGRLAVSSTVEKSNVTTYAAV